MARRPHQLTPAAVLEAATAARNAFRTIVEVREDQHGNEYEISAVTKSLGGLESTFYTVRSKGSPRWFINKKTGTPYFASLASARRKVDTN